MESHISNKVYHIFENHVPENTIHYCFDLWDCHRFNFIITNKRNSKLGDYRYKKANNSHTITINNNLNKYSFLITYLHEVAHLITFKKEGFKALPHGSEWKNSFKELLSPVVNELVFPQDLIKHIYRYIQNPKASSCSDHNLATALAKYDENDALVHLSEVAIGNIFIFNRKMYEMENVKRTRYVCKEVSSGRKYLISKIAKVELLAKSNPSID